MTVTDPLGRTAGDAQPGMKARAEALEEKAWKPLARRPRWSSRTGATGSRREDVKARIVRERGYVNKRLNCEDVAEFEYRPVKCRKTYRMGVVRKNISRMKGDLTLLDEFRYFFYITTRRDIGAAEVVRLANARCDRENVIAQLKSGVGAMRVPVYDLESNWAHMKDPSPTHPGRSNARTRARFADPACNCGACGRPDGRWRSGGGGKCVDGQSRRSRF